MSWRAYFQDKTPCPACGRFFYPEDLTDGDCPDCYQNRLVLMFRGEK